MNVTLQKISKTFAETGTVLQAIDLELESASFTTIIGPSGCGKSTLLRILADLEKPSSGTLTMSLEKPEISMVFQDPRLLPWRNNFQNVKLPLEISGRKDVDAQVLHALDLVGLEDYAKRYPDVLSGGMKMRVSLARALVTQPKLMLLDEPFAALDEMTREYLNMELLRLWDREKWTALFITHNIFEAAFLSQRVIVMGHKPGIIKDIVPIDLPWPREESVRASSQYAEYVGILQESLKEHS